MKTLLVYSDNGPWSAHNIGVIGAIESVDGVLNVARECECNDTLELTYVDVSLLWDILTVNDIKMITNGTIISVGVSGCANDTLSEDLVLPESGWLYIAVEYG